MSETVAKTASSETDINLRRFLQAYDREGAYWIAPAAISPDSSPSILTELAVLKKGLPVKRFQDIGDLDVEVIVRTLLRPPEAA